jgi:hypothetical protein
VTSAMVTATPRSHNTRRKADPRTFRRADGLVMTQQLDRHRCNVGRWRHLRQCVGTQEYARKPGADRNL